jgi:hypothetical protein
MYVGTSIDNEAGHSVELVFLYVGTTFSGTHIYVRGNYIQWNSYLCTWELHSVELVFMYVGTTFSGTHIYVRGNYIYILAYPAPFCMHDYVCTNMHTYIHYVCTNIMYVQTYIRAYIHTYIHTSLHQLPSACLIMFCFPFSFLLHTPQNFQCACAHVYTYIHTCTTLCILLKNIHAQLLKTSNVHVHTYMLTYIHAQRFSCFPSHTIHPASFSKGTYTQTYAYIHTCTCTNFLPAFPPTPYILTQFLKGTYTHTCTHG